MKRSQIGISLLLIFAVILTACSGQTKTIGKYDEAYASHKPEETVLFIEGKPICWEEFFYHIVYYITYL